jgi:hypothetical protein
MDDGPTTFTVSLEGVTEMEAADPHKFCTTIAIARKRQANYNSYNAIVLHVCREQPAQKTDDPQYPLPYPATLLRVGHRGQGYEE